MINLAYTCNTCDWSSYNLDDAQRHSDSTTHHVRISGFLTPKPRTTQTGEIAVSRTDAEIQEANAKRRARENEIMRRAKEKGLLKK